MTLRQLSATLPNGFHDAIVQSIAVDYKRQEASLEIDFDFSVPEVPGNVWRSGTVLLQPFVYFFIVPSAYLGELSPQPFYIEEQAQEEVRNPPVNLPEPPAGAFGYCFFDRVGPNAIFLAARDVSLNWTSELFVRRAQIPVGLKGA